MKWPWQRRKHEVREEHRELQRIKDTVSQIDQRTKRALRDNHFISDVKKVLGAQP